MDILLLVLHVFLSLGIIILVLLQKGSGASAGAAFGGGGGAGSVFGATGSANFLSRMTSFLAVGFFVNSLVLAYMAANRDMHTDSVLDALIAPVTEIVAPAELSNSAADVPQADVPVAAETVNDHSEIPSAADVPAADMPPPVGE